MRFICLLTIFDCIFFLNFILILILFLFVLRINHPISHLRPFLPINWSEFHGYKRYNAGTNRVSNALIIFISYIFLCGDSTFDWHNRIFRRRWSGFSFPSDKKCVAIQKCRNWIRKYSQISFKKLCWNS